MQRGTEVALSGSATDTPVFPQRRSCPYEPPAYYRELSAQGPMSQVTLWNGRVVWLVTGYSHGRRLLSDERLSSDRSRDEYPSMAPNLSAEAARKLVLVGMDPPEHDVHRRLLGPYFGLKRTRAMRPVIQEIVDDLIDRMLARGGTADLVPDFAVPIPSRVMFQLLGLPVSDAEFFDQATAGIMQAADAASAQEAGGQLARYLDALGTEQERDPRPGLLGDLATLVNQSELSHGELVQIAVVLLIAGLETTASMIPAGMLALLRHPDQLRAVRTGEVSWSVAIEELLRVIAVTDFAAVRWAKADIEIDGQRIKAGEGVVVSSPMVNRDPAAHPDPDDLRIGRGSRRHMTFGYGIHQCLGQNLARLQLEIAYETIFGRIPGLRLAVPADQVPMRQVGTMQGLQELVVTW